MHRLRPALTLALLAALTAAGCATVDDGTGDDDRFKLLAEYEKCVRESNADIRDLPHDPFRCEALRKRLEAQARPSQAAVTAGGAPSPSTAAQREAQAHVERGNAALAQGRLDEAVAEYTRAIERAPDDPTAYNNRGLARARQGRSADAIRDFDEAVRRARSAAEAADSATNRGDVQAQTGHPADAGASYTEAIRRAEAAPDGAATAAARARAYVNRGNALAEQGRPQEAIADYDRALAADPASAAAYVNRGNAALAQGRHAEARRDYDRAIALEPGNAAAFNNRGGLSAIEGQADRARADYGQAERLAPGRTPARGNLEALNRTRPTATPAARTPTAAERREADAHSQRGMDLYDDGRYREAAAECEAAARLRPGNALDELCAGLSYEQMGDRARAIEYLRRARALDPTLKDADVALERLGVR